MAWFREKAGFLNKSHQLGIPLLGSQLKSYTALNAFLGPQRYPGISSGQVLKLLRQDGSCANPACLLSSTSSERIIHGWPTRGQDEAYTHTAEHERNLPRQEDFEKRFSHRLEQVFFIVPAV